MSQDNIIVKKKVIVCVYIYIYVYIYILKRRFNVFKECLVGLYFNVEKTRKCQQKKKKNIYKRKY